MIRRYSAIQKNKIAFSRILNGIRSFVKVQKPQIANVIYPTLRNRLGGWYAYGIDFSVEYRPGDIFLEDTGSRVYFLAHIDIVRSWITGAPNPSDLEDFAFDLFDTNVVNAKHYDTIPYSIQQRDGITSEMSADDLKKTKAFQDLMHDLIDLEKRALTFTLAEDFDPKLKIRQNIVPIAYYFVNRANRPSIMIHDNGFNFDSFVKELKTSEMVDFSSFAQSSEYHAKRVFARIPYSRLLSIS